MRAVVLSEFGPEENLVFRDWPDPVPGEGDVLLEVLACGVNHVDLDVRSGLSRFGVELPLILGREIVGRVAELGGGASDLKVGDVVAAGEMFTSCWRCEQCLEGRDNLCWNVAYPGLFRDGGYAEMVAVASSGCMAVPDGVDPVTAAASQVTYGTAWRALLNRGGALLPGETVLVTAAASGVGTAAVQVAASVGARVIAAAGDPSKLPSLSELGAEWVVSYRERDLAEAVAEITGGRGVDLAFEIAGGPLFRAALASLRIGGRLVLAGAHGGEVVPTDLIPIFRYERSVIGTARATRREMQLAFEALASGRFRPMVDAVLPMDQASEAHRRLAGRRNVGKVVLVPAGR